MHSISTSRIKDSWMGGICRANRREGYKLAMFSLLNKLNRARNMIMKIKFIKIRPRRHWIIWNRVDLGHKYPHESYPITTRSNDAKLMYFYYWFQISSDWWRNCFMLIKVVKLSILYREAIVAHQCSRCRRLGLFWVYLQPCSLISSRLRWEALWIRSSFQCG